MHSLNFYILGNFINNYFYYRVFFVLTQERSLSDDNANETV